MAAMTKKQFAKFLARDFNRCWHCGASDETLVGQHRKGRQMGGSKSATTNGTANIIVFCSEANGRLESDAAFAKVARSKGWALNSWQTPDSVPVFDVVSQCWYQLDDLFGRVVCEQGL